ncbi:DUF4097 family beta strand repeat-containing protein [Streptomyces carpaticus]|uniref:DUF4097 domain-containing protein n=1 Tax=Streptomyces carpaticus TaxID=285558 RepID=A0ABV4ZJ10_9ACTN
MPVYTTPTPLSLTLDFGVGTARVIASEGRTETVVEVLPADPRSDADTRAAEQTQIDLGEGKLLVKGPRKRSPFGKAGSLDIRVELPAGSAVRGTSPMADFLCTGPLGDCHLRTSLGDIRVEQATTAKLRTDHGTLYLEWATGDTELAAGGRIEAGHLAGAAAVKNSNGETAIEEITGALRVNSANGRVTVGRAHSDVEVRSANGSIHLGQVVRGKITLQAAAHDIEVGLAPGTAALLELLSQVGTVQSTAESVEGPGGAAETVEIRATTGVGDITVRRAPTTAHLREVH